MELTSKEPLFALEEVGADIIYSVLVSFKKHILNSPKTKKLVQPLLQEIEKYMDSTLQKADIGYVNKEDIQLFLVKHFDSVHAIVESCTLVRQKLGNKLPMNLELLRDKPTSENASLRLCLYLPEFSEKIEEEAEIITAPITDKFLKRGFLFYVMPEYLVTNE